ncbi:universal stress protein [Vagococcus sp. JNUCC 83]
MQKEYKKILVAMDGSKESERALKKAVHVTKRNNATLYIAHIVDMRAFETVSSYDETLATNAKREAETALKQYVDYAHEHHLETVETVIRIGVPKIVLSEDLPEELGIDLIMLGATGLNAMERILLGSVSSYVSIHAKSDVLVVRTDIDNKN